MFVWEEYQTDCFVGRQEVLERIVAWVDDHALAPVGSLVAPAGAGKTWVLKAARERLEQRATPNSSPDRLVFWVDVVQLVDQAPARDDGTLLSPPAVRGLLANIYDQTRKFYDDSDALPDDDDFEPTTLIQALVTDLCEHRQPRFAPVVLVDGYGEISPRQASYVDRLILEPFLGQRCVRMLIGRRDDNALRNYRLRMSEHRLPLNPDQAVRQQFVAFKAQYHPDADHLNPDNLDMLLDVLRMHYAWDHFFINAFLFNCALARSDVDLGRLLTVVDLEICWKLLIMRPVTFEQAQGVLSSDEMTKLSQIPYCATNQVALPRFFTLSPDAAKILRQIANELPEQWTPQDLETRLRLRTLNNAVRQLFDYGVVANVTRTGRYTVAQGLRELLRAAEQLRAREEQ